MKNAVVWKIKSKITSTIDQNIILLKIQGKSFESVWKLGVTNDFQQYNTNNNFNSLCFMMMVVLFLLKINRPRGEYYKWILKYSENLFNCCVKNEIKKKNKKQNVFQQFSLTNCPRGYFVRDGFRELYKNFCSICLDSVFF